MRTLNKLISIAPNWIESILSPKSPVEIVQLIQMREHIVVLTFVKVLNEYQIIYFNLNKLDEWEIEERINDSTKTEYEEVIEQLELETLDDLANYLFVSQFAGECM